MKIRYNQKHEISVMIKFDQQKQMFSVRIFKELKWGTYPNTYHRDNYNFFGMPEKMSGQINVSLTFASYRNFF